MRHMEQQLEPAAFAKLWEAFFPGQLPERVGMAEEMDDSGELWLEGHVLKAIEVGHADTYDSTVLHVPDLELVVCGDVVYGDVHQFLVEANTKAKREEWIRAVERVKELNPKVVVPGHKREGAVDGVWCLDATIGYLRDFGEFLEGGARDGKELFGLMMVKYGGRVNEHALLGGCKAAFSTRKKSVL